MSSEDSDFVDNESNYSDLLTDYSKKHKEFSLEPLDDPPNRRIESRCRSRINSESTEDSSLRKRAPKTPVSGKGVTSYFNQAKKVLISILHDLKFLYTEYKMLDSSFQIKIQWVINKIMTKQGAQRLMQATEDCFINHDDFLEIAKLYTEKNRKTARYDTARKSVCKMAVSLIRQEILDSHESRTSMKQLWINANKKPQDFEKICFQLKKVTNGRSLQEKKVELDEIMFEYFFNRKSRIISVEKQRQVDQIQNTSEVEKKFKLQNEAMIAFQVKTDVTKNTVQMWRDYGANDSYFCKVLCVMKSRELMEKEFKMRNADLIDELIRPTNTKTKNIFEEYVNPQAYCPKESAAKSKIKCPISIVQHYEGIEITLKCLKNHAKYPSKLAVICP